MSWCDDKVISLGANAVSYNSQKRRKKKKKDLDRRSEITFLFSKLLYFSWNACHHIYWVQLFTIKLSYLHLYFHTHCSFFFFKTFSNQFFFFFEIAAFALRLF